MAQNGLNELPRYPTEAEEQRAQQARSPQRIAVRGNYEVVDGVLRPIEGSSIGARHYMPAGATGLLKEAARLDVHDEASLVTFARRWDILGYQHIITATDQHIITATDHPRRVGPLWDPLVWIWAHVTGIRTALDLYRRLRRRDEDALDDYLEALRRLPDREQEEAQWEVEQLMHDRKWAEAYQLIPVLSERPRPPDAWDSLYVRFGERLHITGRRFILSRLAPAQKAWHIICAILNPNLAGCQTSLRHPTYLLPRESSDKGAALDPWARPVADSTFDSVLSAVYWHLKQLITAARVQECDECRFLFVQEDGRQKFCPPTNVERQEGKRDSRCAMRSRKRRQRLGGQR